MARPAPESPEPAPYKESGRSPRSMPEASVGTTRIGKSIIVKGEIRGNEDLRIDGQLEGKLDLGQHRLTVGPDGQVRATIRAREVDVQGAVNGNVEASDRIIIRQQAKLVGDLKMAGVVIEDGAYFKGSIDITRGVQPAPSAPAGPPIVDKSAGRALSG